MQPATVLAPMARRASRSVRLIIIGRQLQLLRLLDEGVNHFSNGALFPWRPNALTFAGVGRAQCNRLNSSLASHRMMMNSDVATLARAQILVRKELAAFSSL